MAGMGFPDKIAFELPYFKADGRPSGFSRWRYLEDTREGFVLHTDAKAIRYVQKADSLQQVYMPPLIDWLEVQADVDTPIAITEGELKAACCTKHCMPCLGLGGVYSFKSSKRGLPLLPVFRDFKWAGRTVIVVFDSDAATNHLVVSARNALCRELLSLGAVPCVAELTPTENGLKRGLDDAVLEDGAEAIIELLSMAESFAASEALHDLNEEVAYVTDPGIVVVMATGQKMRASDFTSHAYADRHYTERKFDSKGLPRDVEVPAAPKWLSWQARAVLTRVTYDPGAEKVNAKREYNMWPGWKVQPKKGNIKPWKELLDHLFIGHPEERLWFEQWLAIPLQSPGAKQFTAAVLWGTETGTGKSLIGYTMEKIYGENFTEIGDVELGDARNEWAQNKQFVMGDDVTGQEQRKFADRIKKMITQQKVRFDPKYIPSFSTPDHINYYFTSNHSDAFFLEDMDRRFFIHCVMSGPLAEEWYRAYVEWANGDGAAALFYHLLHLDLGDRRPEDRAMATAAKMAMMHDGLSDLGVWVRQLRDDPDFHLKVGEAKLAGDLWSATELLRMYDPGGNKRVTGNGMARELKKAGLHMACMGTQVKTNDGMARLFAVRQPAKWMGATAAAAKTEYDKTHSVVQKAKKF